MKVVEVFTYMIGCPNVSCSGSSKPKMKRRRIAIACCRSCVVPFDKTTCWRSASDLQLYRLVMLPVFFYSCETWSNTKALETRNSTLCMLCLRRILWIPYLDHVSNIIAISRRGSHSTGHHRHCPKSETALLRTCYPLSRRPRRLENPVGGGASMNKRSRDRRKMHDRHIRLIGLQT